MRGTAVVSLGYIGAAVEAPLPTTDPSDTASPTTRPTPDATATVTTTESMTGGWTDRATTSGTNGATTSGTDGATTSGTDGDDTGMSSSETGAAIEVLPFDPPLVYLPENGVQEPAPGLDVHITVTLGGMVT